MPKNVSKGVGVFEPEKSVFVAAMGVGAKRATIACKKQQLGFGGGALKCVRT